MDKKNFGYLVATLRKEARNEFDETLTQYDLAELARMPLITLQKIEQGRQANIKPDMLLNLPRRSIWVRVPDNSFSWPRWV